MEKSSVFDGNRVFRARRYLLGLTQPEVADRVGLSAPDISRIEAQGWLPPVAVRAQLAEVLGMPPEELFGPQPDLGPRPDAIVLRDGVQADVQPLSPPISPAVKTHAPQDLPASGPRSGPVRGAGSAEVD